MVKLSPKWVTIFSKTYCRELVSTLTLFFFFFEADNIDLSSLPDDDVVDSFLLYLDGSMFPFRCMTVKFMLRCLFVVSIFSRWLFVEVILFSVLLKIFFNVLIEHGGLRVIVDDGVICFP